MMPFPRRPVVGALARLALVAAVCGLSSCAKVPTQTASMQATPEVASSAALIQLQAFETGRTLSTIIERAADSIRDATTDPEVRRNALLWKISAVPLAQEAALRADPVIAAADLYTLTIQLSDYLMTGAGSHSFGAEQPIAVAAAAACERSALALVQGNLKSGQLSGRSEAYLRKWAAEHPMSGPALRRASILSSDWKALGISDNSLTATVGNMDRTLSNITYRLSYLNETLSAQARWNAELAAGDAMNSPRFDTILGTGTAALRSVGTLADTLPPLIDIQREALMREIDRERILAFQDISVQRVALMEALSRERAALIDQLQQERIASFVSADSLAQRSIDRTIAAVRQLVLELAAAALVVSVVLLAGGSVLVGRWRAKAA